MRTILPSSLRLTRLNPKGVFLLVALQLVLFAALRAGHALPKPFGQYTIFVAGAFLLLCMRAVSALSIVWTRQRRVVNVGSLLFHTYNRYLRLLACYLLQGVVILLIGCVLAGSLWLGALVAGYHLGRQLLVLWHQLPNVISLFSHLRLATLAADLEALLAFFVDAAVRLGEPALAFSASLVLWCAVSAYCLVRWSLAVDAIVVEDVSAAQALDTSWRRSKGSAGYLLLTNLVFLVALVLGHFAVSMLHMPKAASNLEWLTVAPVWAFFRGVLYSELARTELRIKLSPQRRTLSSIHYAKAQRAGQLRGVPSVRSQALLRTKAASEAITQTHHKLYGR